MRDIRSKLRARVDSFVDDLEVLVRELALEAVAGALSGAQVPASTDGRSQRQGQRRGPHARPKGQKRSADELGALTANLLSYVQKHPGERVEQIAKGLGVSSKDLQLPTRKLLGEKALRKKGQKRATTYFAK